jgi:hypothetical protein
MSRGRRPVCAHQALPLSLVQGGGQDDTWPAPSPASGEDNPRAADSGLKTVGYALAARLTQQSLQRLIKKCCQNRRCAIQSAQDGRDDAERCAAAMPAMAACAWQANSTGCCVIKQHEVHSSPPSIRIGSLGAQQHPHSYTHRVSEWRRVGPLCVIRSAQQTK